jgi:hypothetical protein
VGSKENFLGFVFSISISSGLIISSFSPEKIKSLGDIG